MIKFDAKRVCNSYNFYNAQNAETYHICISIVKNK